MSNVGQLIDTRQDRPSYVRFERVAVDDAAASLAAGYYVAKDVDYALVTPSGSKDIFKCKAAQWLLNLRQDVENNRLPQDWLDKYSAAYKSWLAGQEIPLEGSPIKGWGVISPALQETLTRLNILTVEDLARINDEAVRRIGMGAIDLKTKAQAWLSQLQDKGPLVQEISAIKAENEALKADIASLRQAVESLKAAPIMEQSAPAGISVADILDDEDEFTTDVAIPVDLDSDDFGPPPHPEALAAAYKAKFGRRPHPAMNPDKLRRVMA